MNEASTILEFPPPLTPSSHPFSRRFPLLTLTHTLQSFRGTAWRLHTYTHQPFRATWQDYLSAVWWYQCVWQELFYCCRSAGVSECVCVSESETEIDFNEGTLLCGNVW